MIPRQAASTLIHLAKDYPVIAVTGPRQSGKTTLCRALFPESPYASLEDPDVREFAQDDPRGFLAQYPNGAVLDEVQRCPELFAYLQRIVDENPQPGRFILTGSQQFGLLSGITQSLAGRVALLSLLPFSIEELRQAKLVPEALDRLLLAGGYPPIHDRQLDPVQWYGNYVQTYLERDVRQLINVRDLTQFQRFVRLCAGRTGQLLNFSTLGDDAGVSHNTAREWLSVLEASYVIHRLAPHHRNFNKRLVKTPKLYFLDTGLAAWLLGIENERQLSTHPLRGALFETWVVSEYLKVSLSRAQAPNLTFWRDRAGHGVDLLVERGGTLTPVEVKAGATVRKDALRGLLHWMDIAGGAAGEGVLVYAGDQRQKRGAVHLIPWRMLLAAEPVSPTD